MGGKEEHATLPLGNHAASGFDSKPTVVRTEEAHHHGSSAPRAGANLPVSLELSGDGFLAGWGNRETGTTARISKNEQHLLVDACRAARITPAASNTFRSNGWAVDTLHPAYEVHRM